MEQELGHVQSIRTMQTSGQRSMPQNVRSAHLDVYMLGKEIDRLEKELSNLDRRRTDLHSKLDDAHKRMDRLQKPAAAKRARGLQEFKEPSSKTDHMRPDASTLDRRRGDHQRKPGDANEGMDRLQRPMATRKEGASQEYKEPSLKKAHTRPDASMFNWKTKTVRQ